MLLCIIYLYINDLSCILLYYFILHIIAPHPPENVSALVVNSTTVEVTWDPPSITNGILRYYTVLYGSSDDMEMMEVNSSDVTLSGSGEDICSGISIGSISLLVSVLDPFTSYTFYVLAVTVAPSEPSDNVTVFIDEAGTVRAIACINFHYTTVYK